MRIIRGCALFSLEELWLTKKIICNVCLYFVKATVIFYIRSIFRAKKVSPFLASSLLICGTMYQRRNQK